MVMGGLICKGEPYNPAILTSIDDDAVGEMIYFSDGYPQTAANATPYLDLTCARAIPSATCAFALPIGE